MNKNTGSIFKEKKTKENVPAIVNQCNGMILEQIRSIYFTVKRGTSAAPMTDSHVNNKESVVR